MGTSKRERQKQGRQARIAQARAAAARRKRLRTGVLLGGLVVLLVGGTLAYAASQDDEDDVTAGATTSTTAGGSTTSTAEGTASTVAVTFPEPGDSIIGDTPCPEADGTSPRTTSFEAAPPMCIDTSKTYTATVVTTMGEFVLELDDQSSPIAVNNFVVLARYHFYDGVSFHRIIPGFVIQAGDPVGPNPGSGGPGYSIEDELPDPAATGVYAEGTLAMANSGPNSGGSQFFVTVGNGGDSLSNDYTPFGRVISGIEVVRSISENGDAPSNGTPTAEINIETITISES